MLKEGHAMGVAGVIVGSAYVMRYIISSIFLTTLTHLSERVPADQ